MECQLQVNLRRKILRGITHIVQECSCKDLIVVSFRCLLSATEAQYPLTVKSLGKG